MSKQYKFDKINNTNNLCLPSIASQQIEHIIAKFGSRAKFDICKRNQSDYVEIPKRPFLKRGEGLKNRFKISPDAFRLNNLPKYKFAKKYKKHASNNGEQTKRCHQQEKTNDAKSLLADITNEMDHSECCQNNSYRIIEGNCDETDDPILFQKNSVFSEQNSNQYHDALESSILSNQINLPTFRPYLSTPVAKCLLDTPTRKQVQMQQDELNDLEQFEQLEQNFAQITNMATENNDNSVVLKFKVGLNLSPNQYSQRTNEHDFGKQDESGNQASHIDETKHVRFMSSAEHIDAKCQQRLEDQYISPNEKSMESFQKFKEKLFDRKLNKKFQNQLSLAKGFEISDINTNISCYEDADEETESTHGSETRHHVETKVFQDRLNQLEREIESFREQNAELTSLIREHELIRLTFDQEVHEANERLKNERIKFEIFMNDERLKLLNERAEWERCKKDSHKLHRTEKDELISLREKCSKHATELSSQEQKHIAAQGRLRAQQKNMEKELKELRFEIENLKRENKKLEMENIRLRRESNNKILNQINKSISKLAKTNDVECEKDDTNGKSGVKKCSNKNAHNTVVAKVTTHRQPLGEIRLRSSSVPNLKKPIDDSPYEISSIDDRSECSLNDIESPSAYFSEETDMKNVVSSEILNKENVKSTKKVIENPDGSKDIWYTNGNLKKISADGMSIRMLYFNKDIKETDIKEGTVKYYYAEKNTWQTTYLDGLEIFEYPNGQTEHRFKNGVIEIHFPNGSVRVTDPEREQKEGIKEEWKYADGTNAIQLTNGDRILILPNGQREVHTNGHKRREYPDGTVKIVYPDGSQETRYSNGRVRLKNKDGKLIMDSETISI